MTAQFYRNLASKYRYHRRVSKWFLTRALRKTPLEMDYSPEQKADQEVENLRGKVVILPLANYSPKQKPDQEVEKLRAKLKVNPEFTTLKGTN